MAVEMDVPSPPRPRLTASLLAACLSSSAAAALVVVACCCLGLLTSAGVLSLTTTSLAAWMLRYVRALHAHTTHRHSSAVSAEQPLSSVMSVGWLPIHPHLPSKMLADPASSCPPLTAPPLPVEFVEVDLEQAGNQGQHGHGLLAHLSSHTTQHVEPRTAAISLRESSLAAKRVRC